MEIITETNIKKYYKIFGYINLIFSILLLIFIREIDLKERIYALVAINFVYHMLYLFYTNLYGDSLQMRMNNKYNNIGGGIMLKIFSLLGIISSFIITYSLISISFSEEEYYFLFGICIPFGHFLGAYSLWNKLNSE
jgi:hypothetical protein